MARILTYGYDLSASALFASDASETIQRMAESLVQELRANRKLAGTLRRPIIFVCHGVGGVLVKKSLVYSSTRTAPKVDHLWDQFISTFAILFFGTPHGDVAKSSWLDFEATVSSHKYQYPRIAMNNMGGNHSRCAADRGAVQIPRLVDNDFSPLLRHFNIFFFWEQLPTPLGNNRLDFLVEHRSAAPRLDNTEAAGIHANHVDMVKFRSRDSSDYRTVLAALDTYCEKAPSIISRRWKLAEGRLQELRRGEAQEIGGFGFDVHLEQPFQGFSRVRPRGQLVHFHVPKETTPIFVGRHDSLEDMHKSLFPGGHPSEMRGRKSFIVFGMGGSGKTELCCKFAGDHKDQYTAVFTIRAASPETIKDSYCDIGRLAGLEPTESAGKHFLSQQEEPWLLIIDNADDPSLDFCRLFPHGATDAAHILVTTRVRNFRSEGTLGQLELKGLTETDALQLLLTKADIAQPWDVSVTEAGIQIARALGYLALALIQAGTCVYKGVCKLGEYLEIYSSSRQRLQNSSSSTSDNVNDVVDAVYSTFDVSLGYMMNQVTLASRDAADLLKIIAFFHFERIPLAIFRRAASAREKDLTAAAHSSHLSFIECLLRRLEPPIPLPSFLKGEESQGGGRIDKHRINWAVAELQSLSFVRSDGKYISLHPLIHSWAKDSLSASQRHLWSSIALNTLMKSVLLPPDSSTEADGDFHRDILQHLDTCLANTGNPIPKGGSGLSKLRMRIAAVIQPTLLVILSSQVRIHAKCGWVFAERGQFEKAAEHLDTVRCVLMKMVGVNDERTLTATLGLAGVYWGLVKLDETISLIRSVVQIRSRIYGPKDERTFQAMGKLASALWLHGHHKEALDLQEATWAHMKESLGDTHPETLATLDQLGVTLGSWRRFEESLAAHQFVLQARTEALGDVHPQTLETKSNMGMALLDLGNAHEAKEILTEVFGQRQRQLGKEHPWTLWALCYLAKIDIELGLLDEAEEMLKWGIGAALRSLSEDHLGVLMARGVLAQIYARTNRLDMAEKLTKETLARAGPARGFAHPDCVYGLWKLARLYILKGSREKAIETCREGLERADMRITRNHPIARDIESLLERLEDASKPLRLEDLEIDNTKSGLRLRNMLDRQPPLLGSGNGRNALMASRQPGSTERLAEPARTATW